MKRKKFILPVILVCIISAGIVYKNSFTDKSKYEVNYVQDGAENSLKVDKLKYEKLSNEKPSKVTTYETIKPSDIAKDIEVVLNVFGFSDKYNKTEDENIISFTENGKLLEYYKNTGGVNYYNTSLMNSDKTINFNELNNVKYYEKAGEVLKKLGVNNVSRKHIKPSDIRATDSNNNPTQFKLLNVSFWRELDGKKVMGFDKIMFDFDYNGDLASAMISVRNYQTVEQVSVNSPKQSFEKFKDTKNGYIGTSDLQATEADLVDSELVYWVEEINKKQITKPIYSIKGKTISTSNKSDKNIDDTVYLRIDAVN